MDKISFGTLLKEEPGEEQVSRESMKACIEKLAEENRKLREELIETRAREAKRYDDLQRKNSLEIKRLERALKEQGALASRQEEVSEMDEPDCQKARGRKGGRR